MATPKTSDALPDDLREALEATPDAYAAFLVMPPSHRREYMKFIDEVKLPAARARRILRALAMIAEWSQGKDPTPPVLDESRKLTVRERRPAPASSPAGSRRVTTSGRKAGRNAAGRETTDLRQPKKG